jgi:hypothetical protein
MPRARRGLLSCYQSRLEKQQPGYMKLEWQWYGMDRQEMLKREKDLGPNKKPRREKGSNK